MLFALLLFVFILIDINLYFPPWPPKNTEKYKVPIFKRKENACIRWNRWIYAWKILYILELRKRKPVFAILWAIKSVLTHKWLHRFFFQDDLSQILSFQSSVSLPMTHHCCSWVHPPCCYSFSFSHLFHLFQHYIFLKRGVYIITIWIWSFVGWLRALGLICSIIYFLFS